MFYLTAANVEEIHDEILNPGELRGLAGNKSLEGTLARVENRLAYGLVADAYELAALYAMAVSQGHCFNDGNKRTAFRVMEVVLVAHGIQLDWRTPEIGDLIIRLAQGHLDPGDLADWLRERG